MRGLFFFVLFMKSAKSELCRVEPLRYLGGDTIGDIKRTPSYHNNADMLYERNGRTKKWEKKTNKQNV